MTSGGSGAPNCTKSIETREKLSKANKGRKASEETKRKISEAHKGMHLSSKSPSARKILQYDLDGNFVKEWDCFMDIERELNIGYTNVWAVCNGKRKQIKGYIWKYKDAKDENKEHKYNENKSKTSISYNGKTQSLTQWAIELDIPFDTLWSRINKLKWTIEKAFTQPYKKRG